MFYPHLGKVPSLEEARARFAEDILPLANKLKLEKKPALIVDFGSYECRAGLSSIYDLHK